jgi:hypothetical protein
VPANAAKVPRTALITMPGYCASNSLLIAPSATPSARAKASTSAGLMTRLNELTSDSRNAPPAPSIASRPIWPRSALVLTSPMYHQVANAAAKTSAIEMAVFWTTESTVIRLWSTWPGVPVLPASP